MAPNDYSPRQALELLMRKLHERDQALARQVQSAIDMGKDVEETERTGRGKQRVYRRTVRFSDEEALKMAIDALQACFVEQPLFVKSAKKDFLLAAIGVPDTRSFVLGRERQRAFLTHEGEEKSVEIELQTETQVLREAQQTFPLDPVAEPLIEQQTENLNELRSLTNFNEE
jgi:hypothetical protein